MLLVITNVLRREKVRKSYSFPMMTLDEEAATVYTQWKPSSLHREQIGLAPSHCEIRKTLDACRRIS